MRRIHRTAPCHHIHQIKHFEGIYKSKDQHRLNRWTQQRKRDLKKSLSLISSIPYCLLSRCSPVSFPLSRPFLIASFPAALLFPYESRKSCSLPSFFLPLHISSEIFSCPDNSSFLPSSFSPASQICQCFFPARYNRLFTIPLLPPLHRSSGISSWPGTACSSPPRLSDS